MKILVQIPYDWDHIKGVPTFIIEKIKHLPISIFTPSIYAEAHLYEGSQDFTARILSTALTIGKKVELVPWSDAPIKLYIGAAPRSIEFDEIIAYKPHILSTQEEYIQYLFHMNRPEHENMFSKNIYKSSDAKINFEDLESMTEYLLLLGASHDN
jgi:hypothetical protein